MVVPDALDWSAPLDELPATERDAAIRLVLSALADVRAKVARKGYQRGVLAYLSAARILDYLLEKQERRRG